MRVRRWDQHPGRKPSSTVGGSGLWGSLRRGSASPMGSLDPGRTLQSCPDLGQEAWIFILTREGGVPLEEAAPFSEGNSQPGPMAEPSP